MFSYPGTSWAEPRDRKCNCPDVLMPKDVKSGGGGGGRLLCSLLAEGVQSWDFPCTQSLKLWECSFLMRLNLWLPYLLLQHPHWNAEDQRAHFTLIKTILKAGGFFG